MKENEYNQLVHQIADGLYRFAVKLMKNEQDARDAVQIAFEKLWMRREDIIVEKSKSYLFTMVNNWAIDQHRRSQRWQTVEPEPSAFMSRPEANRFEQKQLIEMALEQLPDIQRSLVLLRDYEGYSYEEMGGITGLEESQVKVYLFRARKKLQQILA